MAEAPADLDPVSMFSLLGDETRLAVLQALYDETRGRGTGRGAVAYSTLREAVGEPDSGRFNYHLTQLTGHFVEKLRGGYALRAPGREVVRVLRAGTLTQSPRVDPVGTGRVCPRCGGQVRLSYANEHVFVHCADCVGLLEFDYVPDGTLLAVSFPPAGANARDPSTLLAPATLGYERRLQTMTDGLCPDCGGVATPSVRRCECHRQTGSTTCDRCHTGFEALVELSCETCERRRVAPPAFAFTHRDPVREALSAANADGDAWRRYVTVVDWPTRVRRADGGTPEVVYAPPDDREVVVAADGSVRREAPSPPDELGAHLSE
ncbi:DUF7351 domain-containing protein [Candidatus Halobonum tyrrellensis]|uniref:ArsR family transcriptional regulator n=1 Tax=Candidatus Halobonum tyrrellensis G22 TaxID=1324957 RepID=V4HMS4_9EURY|nr:transcriptional regulator [Candidatus Halobonum tyrrellensis]ESP89229.1 hypothetical protein K933_04406 [Candidatus Halobonum tyrrellensis G22]